MGSINIYGFEKDVPQVVEGDIRPNVTVGNEFTYKDIRFDLEYGAITDNNPADNSSNTTDLSDLRDLAAIKQAIFNLFTTVPGQKLLNPTYGLNLSHFCFEPITQITADHIARTVLIEAPKNEPRIDIIHLEIVGNGETNTYEITFSLTVPEYDNTVLNIKGIINGRCN